MLTRPTLRFAQASPFKRSVRSNPTQAERLNPHNNKRPNQPNPAISRLSASPTPSNATRHSNAAQGVRETYICAAIRCVRLRCLLKAPWARPSVAKGI